MVLLLHGNACRPPTRPSFRPVAGFTAPPAPPAGAADEADAKRQAVAADTLAARGQVAAAERARDNLLAQHPATQAAAVLLNARAERAAAQARPAEAAALWGQLLRQHRRGEGQPDAKLDHMHLAYAEQLALAGHADDAVQALQGLFAQPLEPAMRLRVGATLARMLQQLGRGSEAVELYVELAGSPSLATNLQQSYIDQAGAALDANLTLAALEALYKAHGTQPNWAPLQAHLTLTLAQSHYQAREFERCEPLLRLVARGERDGPRAAQARELLQLLRDRAVVDRQAIGVLLPLSGRFKQYGERSLRAIELAFAGQTHIRLVVRDTQGDATLAAEAAQALVMQAHVMVIVGPLFSAEAWAAAQKAQELGVPLLALSFRDGLPQVGPYVFRNALTVAAQAKALANVAIDTLGMRRFALLYPRTRYGLDFTAAFWGEVLSRHGEIRGAESYEPEQTTFREPVRKLVGRWFLTARPEYKEALEALRQQKLPPLRMRAEVDKLNKGTAPIVDFDAIVLPDSGRQLGLLAPALAFEDIVLTHDPKRLEKIRRASGESRLEPLTLLGASTWNTTQTIDSCDQTCEDAVFVDAFFAASTSPKWRDFVAAFHAQIGADPFLTEAQAFDSAGLLLRLFKDRAPSSRDEVRDTLLAMPPYPGVIGDIHFDADGEAQRNLFVLTIKDHAIELWRPPSSRLRG